MRIQVSRVACLNDAFFAFGLPAGWIPWTTGVLKMIVPIERVDVNIIDTLLIDYMAGRGQIK